MRGYYEMPDETAAVMLDGWLRTGDLVTVNADDTYTFVGRKKEVIRRRGENLSPAEVEAALERHPDVAEAAVIGVPSDLSEEDVKAFVVAAPGRAVDVAALHAFAGEQLAAFKVPRYIEVVDELPHTPTGRLAKHHLPDDRTPGRGGLRSHALTVSGDDGERVAAHVDRVVGSRPHHRRRPRSPVGDHGPVHADRARVPAGDPARADRRADPAPRRGARVARRPRAHAERAGGPAHLHRRARGDAGRGRRRTARRGERVPRPGR